MGGVTAELWSDGKEEQTSTHLKWMTIRLFCEANDFSLCDKKKKKE